MTDDWKTLRVPADQYERAKAQKEADGRTWGEQIVRPDDDDEGGELAELKALVGRLPGRTADEIEQRFGGRP